MDSFIGEIRILPYYYPPMDWAYCNGALLQVQQNTALYSIIGNVYGGTPNSNFCLPNMAPASPGPGSAPIGAGTGPSLTPRPQQAASVGSTSVTLTVQQIPSHTHIVSAQTTTVLTDFVDDPTNNYLGHGEKSGTSSFFTYAPVDPAHVTNLKNPLGGAGTGLAHENRQPFLPMNFCISLAGEYPIRP